MKLLDLVYRICPAIGRTTVRLWYQYMTRLDKKAEMVFMNYGYVDLNPDASELSLQADDESNRYCIQLYHHVAGAVDLKGRDVLEVGCGRGGGASYIARCLGPRSMTGVDVAEAAVDFCNRYHSAPGLSFAHGDAELLPFLDNSFDAVVNVESSHCYGSLRRFLVEVHRLLRPDGYFLFADRRYCKEVGSLRDQLKRAGFGVVREQKITRNILKALELDNERKLALIDRSVPWFFRKVFKQFAATRGTSLYESFRKGHWEYLSFVLRKNSARPQTDNPSE